MLLIVILASYIGFLIFTYLYLFAKNLIELLKIDLIADLELSRAGFI